MVYFAVSNEFEVPTIKMGITVNCLVLTVDKFGILSFTLIQDFLYSAKKKRYMTTYGMIC